MIPAVFDPIALLRVLNRHRVRYLLIGGFAATAYGSPLPTVDVDVTPEPTRDNLRRLSGALDDLGARVRVEGIPEGLAFAHSGDSLREIAVLSLVTRLGDLDLVLRPAGGAAYAELAARAVTVHLHGMDVALASLDDVIASKEAADRPKDRQALPILRALRQRLRTDGERSQE